MDLDLVLIKKKIYILDTFLIKKRKEKAKYTIQTEKFMKVNFMMIYEMVKVNSNGPIKIATVENG
jgi:hypothetical protein